MSIIVRAPSLRLALEENAFDFLAEGVQRFARRADSSDLKYAILSIAQATELFLKARLAREHKTLVFVDPGKASPDSPTVGVDAAMRRLQAAGIPLTPRDTADLATLRELRNCLLHYQIDVLEGDAEASFGRAVSFLEVATGSRIAAIDARSRTPLDLTERPTSAIRGRSRNDGGRGASPPPHSPPVVEALAAASRRPARGLPQGSDARSATIRCTRSTSRW